MQLTTSFGSLFVAALATSLAFGSVIPSAPSTGSFEIKRSANPNYVGRNGAVALLNVYRKYKVPAPKSLIVAANFQTAARRKKLFRKRANDTVTASNIGSDVEYNVQVQVGTPPQRFYVDFDTGSSDFWLFSTLMNGTVPDHTYFDPSKSSSAKYLEGESWQITYGDGSSSSGNVYLDTVNVGDLTVIDQAVETAKTVSSGFLSGESDGLFGLAFRSLNRVSPTQQNTFFENISPGLDRKLFTADLRHGAPGSYCFGAIPPQATNIQWAPVNNEDGFWGFNPVSTLSSNGSAGQTTSVNKYKSIADTGTTLLVLGNEETKAYYAQVPGAKLDDSQGGWTFSCSTPLPAFQFHVDSSSAGTITVPGSLLNYGATSNGQCFGGIQSMEGIDFAIYGDVALKAAYVVFDAENLKLGWSQKV